MLGFAAPTLPFAIANYRGAGSLSPAPLGGFDLYIGNHLDGPHPYYNMVAFSSSNPDHQAIHFTIEASRRLGRELSQAEGSAYWIREVLRLAAREPRAFARKLLYKGLAVFNFWEEGDNHSLPFLSEFVAPLRLPMLAFWLVMPLGMAGLLLAQRRDPRARILLAAVVLYTATMVAVFSNMRIRAPLLVILIPYAAIGLREGIRTLSGQRARALTFAALALAFAGLEVIPVPGTRDLTPHDNLHAFLLAKQGRMDEAVKYLTRSAQAGGAHSVYAQVSLASIAGARGDARAAQSWFDRVPDDSVGATTKLNALGDWYRSQKRLEEAARAYERSLEINSAQTYTRRTLISVYQVIAPERARQHSEELDRILGFFGPIRVTLQ